jgi:hypothetical protein
MEVLIAMGIFLLSLAAISALVSQAGQNAVDASNEAMALGMAKTKLAEIECGNISLDQDQDDQEVEESPDFHWSMKSEEPSFPGAGSLEGSIELKAVTVTISHKGINGQMVPCCSLTQLIVDPNARGNTADPANIASSASQNSSSSGSGSGSTSTTGGN